MQTVLKVFIATAAMSNAVANKDEEISEGSIEASPDAYPDASPEKTNNMSNDVANKDEGISEGSIEASSSSSSDASPEEETNNDDNIDTSSGASAGSSAVAKVAKKFRENPEIVVGAAVVTLGVAAVLRQAFLKFVYSCKRQTSALERDLQSESKATKIKGCNKLTAFETNCPEFYYQIVNYTADCDSILKQD